jgi:hypothetical protein
MDRKLIVQKELPGGLVEFPVAVCERKGNDSHVVGWFRTEADARLFAGAEEQIAKLKRELGDADSRSRTYRNRMMCSATGH